MPRGAVAQPRPLSSRVLGIAAQFGGEGFSGGGWEDSFPLPGGGQVRVRPTRQRGRQRHDAAAATADGGGSSGGSTSGGGIGGRGAGARGGGSSSTARRGEAGARAEAATRGRPHGGGAAVATEEPAGIPADESPFIVTLRDDLHNS